MGEPLRPGGAHPGPDLLLDLTLGQAGAAERADATAHLARCGACRVDYDELASGVDLVLPAVPRSAPPPGFEGRVLDRLAAERAGGPGGARSGGVRRRTVLLAAAAGLAGAVTGAGVTAYLRRGDGEVPGRGVPLLTAAGARVGSVSRSYGEGGPVLVVDVDDGPPGRPYTCRLRLADGSSRDVATWSLAEHGPNSWVVEAPAGGEVTAVELVAEGGAVWSRAQL